MIKSDVDVVNLVTLNSNETYTTAKSVFFSIKKRYLGAAKNT